MCSYQVRALSIERQRNEDLVQANTELHEQVVRLVAMVGQSPQPGALPGPPPPLALPYVDGSYMMVPQPQASPLPQAPSYPQSPSSASQSPTSHAHMPFPQSAVAQPQPPQPPLPPQPPPPHQPVCSQLSPVSACATSPLVSDPQLQGPMHVSYTHLNQPGTGMVESCTTAVESAVQSRDGQVLFRL